MLQVLTDSLVLKDLLVSSVTPVKSDLLDSQDKLVQQDQTEHLEIPVPLVHQGKLEVKVHLGPVDPLEHQDQ